MLKGDATDIGMMSQVIALPTPEAPMLVLSEPESLITVPAL